VVAILGRVAPLGQAVREAMDPLAGSGILGMAAMSLWLGCVDAIVDLSLALLYLYL
jgi:hypothetical protein